MLSWISLCLFQLCLFVVTKFVQIRDEFCYCISYSLKITMEHYNVRHIDGIRFLLFVWCLKTSFCYFQQNTDKQLILSVWYCGERCKRILTADLEFHSFHSIDHIQNEFHTHPHNQEHSSIKFMRKKKKIIVEREYKTKECIWLLLNARKPNEREKRHEKWLTTIIIIVWLRSFK